MPTSVATRDLPPSRCARCRRRPAAGRTTPNGGAGAPHLDTASRRRTAPGRGACHSASSAVPNVCTRETALSTSARRAGTVGADQQQALGAAPGFTRRRNASVHRLEVGIDVGVIELDVVDDWRCRAGNFQELSPVLSKNALSYSRLRSRNRGLARCDSWIRGRRSCGRCRRPACSDRRRRASAASPSATWSSSCRACRPARSSARPTGSARGSLRATSSSGSCDRGLPRAPGCRARIALPTTTRSRVAGDVLGRVAGQRADPLRREKIAHRRVDVLIGTLDRHAPSASAWPRGWAIAVPQTPIRWIVIIGRRTPRSRVGADRRRPRAPEHRTGASSRDRSCGPRETRSEHGSGEFAEQSRP